MRKISSPALTAAGLLVGAVLLAACASSGGGSAYGSGDPSLTAANPGGGPLDPFLTDGHAVLRALDAIGSRAGKPLRVLSLDADRMNGLHVDVQEPANHANVDRYVVAPNGDLSGPAPVKMMSLDGKPITAASVDAQAFDAGAIGFARLTQTAREAIAKSGFPDARVSEWEINGLGPDARRYIFLDAARGRPVAVVNPNLTIVQMRF